MKYIGSRISLAIALLGPVLVMAQIMETDAAIEVLPIVFNEKGLQGQGGELLKTELADAQFIALGEDHGFAGAALFGQAIANDARPFGLQYHVVEVGPVSTEWFINEFAKGGMDAIAKSHVNIGRAIPFISNFEDAELAADFLDGDGPMKLWGVDQEFIGAPLILLESLARLANSDNDSAVVNRWLDAERLAFSAGNLDSGMLISASHEDFTRLKSLYPDNIAAQSIIDAMAHSAEIYRYYSDKKYYANNQSRVLTMRSLFLKNYHAAPENAPRVLLKLGLYHLGRGTTPTLMYDLGSLLPGIAAAEQLNSLHIAYMPISGRQSVYSPSAENGAKVKDYEDDSVAVLMAAAGIEPELVGKSGHYVIPLEPLRHVITGKKLRELPKVARFIVQGFDYLVTTRDEAPASKIN